MSSDLDLSSLTLDDLLQGIEDRAGRPPDLVDSWIKSEGYYPGQTRVPASELYASFKDWARLQGATKIPPASHWGVAMARRFKRGRSKVGKFYYISRESESDIGPVAERGGRGNRGGPVPGGS